MCQTVNSGCFHDLVYCMAIAPRSGRSNIKHDEGRVLSPVNCTTSLCAQERVSCDIIHQELKVCIVSGARAARKAAHAAHESDGGGDDDDDDVPP